MEFMKRPYSPTRLQVIKIDFKMECIKKSIKEKDAEIIRLVNEIASAQARLEALNEIREDAYKELTKLSAEHFKFSKELEKEKEGTEQIAG